MARLAIARRPIRDMIYASRGGTSPPAPRSDVNLTLQTTMANRRHIRFLDREVETRNTVNSKANEAAAKLRPLFESHIGTKVTKVDSTFTAAFKKELDAVLSEVKLTGFRFHVTASAYSVSFEIDKTYPDGEYSCQYVKQYFSVAFLRDQCVESLPELPSFRTDYSVGDVEQAMAQIKELEQKIADLESSIRPFVR